MLTAAGLGVVLPMLIVAAAGEPEPPGCAVSDSHGRCLVIAVDPGRPGRPASPDRDEPPGRSEPDESAADDDPVTTPEPERPRLQAVPFGDGGWTQQEALDAADFLDAVPAEAGPAVDPVTVAQVLAQRAIEQLTLDPPVPQTSVIGAGYVGVPVWLWIENGIASTGPVSATATAGAARVTATGRLSAMDWSMGPEGGDLRCASPGTPWTGQAGPSPDCGYTYEQRSLPERTGGSGRWTVVTTGVWTVTWTGVSGGVPVAGEETVRVSAESSLSVGEVQVLVGGARGQHPLDTGLVSVAWDDVGTVVGQLAATDLRAGQTLTPDSVTPNRVPAPGEAVVGLSVEAGRVPSATLAPRDEVLVITGSGSPPRRATVVRAGDMDVSGRRSVDVLVPQADAEELALASVDNRIAIVLLGRG